MRLILMRHGEAEECIENKKDSDRCLTIFGRRKLNEHLPSLARYLMGTDECHIWTSEYRRARETGEILVRYMPGAKIKEKAFINEGSLTGMIDALEQISDKATVVVIGHEPFLSQWVETLTRRSTHFKKGALEILMLKSHLPTEAVRIGQFNLAELVQFEPLDMPFCVAMKHLFLSNQRSILQAKDSFMEDVENDDTLHELRISIRQQKAFLGLIEPYAKKKVYREAQKAYSRLLDDLTHLRELDVLLASIHEAKRWELEPVVPLVMAERNAESLRLDMVFSDYASEEEYAEAYNLSLIALSTVKESEILSTLLESFMPSYFKYLKERSAELLQSENPKKLYLFRSSCRDHCYRYEHFAPIVSYKMARRFSVISTLTRVLGDYGDTFYNPGVLKSITKNSTEPKVHRAVTIYDGLQADRRLHHDHRLRPLLAKLSTS